MRIKSEISSLSNSKSPDFLEDLRKMFRNDLRVRRIQKIIRIFKIDLSKKIFHW
jgi:hypothetical protein